MAQASGFTQTVQSSEQKLEKDTEQWSKPIDAFMSIKDKKFHAHL